MQSFARHMGSAVVRCVLVACASIATLGTQDARADPLGVVNTVRQNGCGSPATPLAHVPQLDAAAQSIADGKKLRAAVDASGYRAVTTTLLSLDGARNDDELGRLVAQSCAQVTQAGLSDAGSYRRGQMVWIVLAEPFRVPSLDKTAVAARVLDLVNQARARPRLCGSEQFGAAPPLQRSPPLEQSAAAHANDMAARANMSHIGSDGSTPSQRVSRAGYQWSAVAENVAAGQRDADRVVRSWLDSPGHCANLMSPQYKDMGVAFATNASSPEGIYWTQVFGAPVRPASAESSRQRR